MAEAEALGVELQPVGGGERLGMGVEGVAEDRVAERGEMHAQLVAAPGQRREREAGRAAARARSPASR